MNHFILGSHRWNHGLGSAEAVFPEESVLGNIAEVALQKLQKNKSKSTVKKISDISVKQHAFQKNTSIVTFSAQIDENDCIPFSVLMKKVNGSSSSIEFQAYSTLFKDLEPNSTKSIYGMLQGSQSNASLYNLIPRPYLTQKPYMFLENLESENCGGFKPVKNALNLDFNHCLLAVETLARFHATSYILRTQLGAKGKGKLEMLQKFPFLNQQSTGQQYSSQMNSRLGPVFEQAFELAIKVIQLENPSLAFKLQRKIINPEAIFEKVVKLLQDEKYDNDDFYLACHGNFTAHNLLFSYENESNKEEPTGCRITNFNSVYFGPLASDLALFLLTCTTLEFRLEFEEKLLAFYCDAFQEQITLRYGGRNNPIVQEFEENIDEFHRKVEKQYRKMLEFAFYNATVLLPLILFTQNTSNNNDISNEICFSLHDLLEDNNLEKYFSSSNCDKGTNRKESNFEKFVVENELFRMKIVEILKQLGKNRVLL